MIFFGKKAEEKLNELDQKLTTSFSNIKEDVNTVYAWINFLNHKLQYQESLLLDLQYTLARMPSTRDEIRHIIDYYYNYEAILKKIQDLEAKIPTIKAPSSATVSIPVSSQSSSYALAEIIQLKNRLDQLEKEIPRRPSLREKIIKRITQKSKEYVKHLMLSLIKKYEKISALQLREIIVEEQGICSKSSFYRILEEIEQDGEVGLMKEGKEKSYFSKLVKHRDI